MITWLINSTLCSGMLLLVYQLLLKNTSLFNFNRAYLLLSVLLSLTVPLVVIHQTGTSLPSIPAFQGVEHTAINYTAPIIEVPGKAPAVPVGANLNYAWYFELLLTAWLLCCCFYVFLRTCIPSLKLSGKMKNSNIAKPGWFLATATWFPIPS